MDKPLLTLNRPHFVYLAVSEDGQWTVILTTLGFDVYDRSGQLVNRVIDRYEQVANINPKRPMIIICGDELGHYDQYGTLHIRSLPDLEEREVYQLPRHDNIHSFIFNERWIIYSTTVAHTAPKVLYRSSDNKIPWELDSETFPESVVGNTVFIPASPPVLYDLVKDEALREFPPQAKMSPDRRYYLAPESEGVAALHNVEDNTSLHKFDVGSESHFCPDNQHLITRFGGGRYVLYDLASGDVAADYTIAEDYENFPKLSLDTMTRFENDRWVRQYDLRTGEHLRDITYLPGLPIELAVSGRYLALLNEKKLLIFDMNSAQIIWDRHTKWPGSRPIKGTLLSGTNVVVQSSDHVEVWDFVSETLIAACPGFAQDVHLALPYLYLSGMPGFRPSKVFKFDIEKQAIVAQRDLDERSQRLLYSQQHGPIINSASLKEFLILDKQTLHDKRTIEGRTFPITFRSRSFIQACDEALVLGTSSETTIRSLADGEVLYDLNTGQGDVVICCTNDVSLLVTVDIEEQKELHFWQPRESNDSVYKITTESPVSRAIIADEHTFVTSHIDGTVNFWDITHITQGLV